MKKSRYSETQIVSILKEAENGVPVSEVVLFFRTGLRLG